MNNQSALRVKVEIVMARCQQPVNWRAAGSGFSAVLCRWYFAKNLLLLWRGARRSHCESKCKDYYI